MKRWTGSLYWACEDSETEHHFIANFNVMAKMRRDAMKMVLDEHWDDRLDSASCYPVFKWEQRGRVLSEVTNAQAIAISNKLGKILQEGNRSIAPAVYADALRDVEAEFGIGAVVLALRQIVGFLQRELDCYAIRSAWGEFDDGLHFLLAGHLLLSVQGVAWEAATAWGQLVRRESLLPAFEREIEVHVRIPPKKTVSATAIVVGRRKAQPNPILDL